MEPTAVHFQVRHNAVACGATDAFPFDVTIRRSNVTCPTCWQLECSGRPAPSALRTQSVITDTLTDPDAESARGISKLQPASSIMYLGTRVTPPCGAEMRELAAWNLLGRISTGTPGMVELPALHGVNGQAVVGLPDAQWLAYWPGIRAEVSD